MTLDPYMTLGLEPDATTAEVKRAYRRLAKAFHPDSAGEAALPRFLAIHEAYEAIKTGRPMGATRAGARPAEPAGGAPASEPWRADPARARAARERARTGRGGPTGGGARTKSSGTAGAAGTAGTAGSSGTAGRSGTSGSRGSRRGTRKATLGSTSYDEARDPADATWSGAAWYGPSSGEYWIINPREYADPRKHGPEYQSRSRKMAAAASVSGTIEDEAPFVAPPVEETDADADLHGQAFETRAAAADPGRTRTRAERASHAAHAAHPRRAQTARPAHAARPARPVRPAATPPPGPGDPTAPWDAGRIRAARSDWQSPIGAPDRDWLNGASDDPVRRLGVALVAWPPIGLAAAAAIGDATGCNVYAATCSGTDSFLPWLAQAGILGLLLLLPALARLLAGGTVAVLIALVPVTAFLLVVGGAGESEAGFALAFLLAVAWIVGVAGSIVAARRRGAPNHAGGAS